MIKLMTFNLNQKNSASACFITVPNMELAKKLAHGIVSNNLAACVNIIPGLTSVYSWENKIQEDNELLLMVKTKSNRVDDLSKFIRENHEYEVAEVISTPIENGNAPYLKWIHDTVPDPQEN